MDTFHGPSAKTSELLQTFGRRLEAGDLQGVLDELRGPAARDPWLANARAVALMRAGYVREAVETCMRLALEPDSIALRPQLPIVFATNYATALLLDQNVEGALVVLRQVADDAHPTVQRLREHVRLWRAGLSLLDRVRFKMYGIVGRPLAAPDPVGELVDPRPEPPRRAA